MTKSITDMEKTLSIRSFPTIRRMRDYHLYDNKGNRYLDLYRLNGYALLGHKPGRVALVMKNMIAKGLSASYPTVHEERLNKALHILLPEYSEFRVFRSWDRAISVLNDATGGKATTPSDPLYSGAEEAEVAYWRPYLENQKLFPIILPIIPAAGDFFPCIAGFSGSAGYTIPGSDVVSPMLLSMLTRSVHDLASYSSEYNEEAWKKFPLPFWNRKGPYLVFSGSKEQYSQVFINCRGQGILIAPEAGKPSIIPGTWTEGEIKFLRKR